MKKQHKPPKLAQRLLTLFIRDDFAEEVSGDLDERFQDDLHTLSPRRARLRYWLEVIAYVRPFAIRKLHLTPANSYAMFRNNVIISWRNLRKRTGYSFINIAGLALGIASFLFLIGYVSFHRSYESFHKNADNIFRITLDLYRGSEYLMTDCEMFAPMAPMAKARMPEVVDFVRMMNNDNPRLKVGEKVFLESQSYFADSSVFNVFSFEPLSGPLQGSLSRPFQAVFTESAAKRFFGRADAVNETFEAEGGIYKVTAIIRDVPPNTHLRFDFLLSHNTRSVISNNQYNDESWSTGNNEYTYLLMVPGTDVDAFNQKLFAWTQELKDKVGPNRFRAERMRDIHLYSHKSFEPDTNANANVIFALLFVAYFILALAWINYINLSTAKSLERAREVGIRKVMGSRYGQLIGQFLMESSMVNILAAVLALIAIRIGLPYFNDMSGIRTTAFFSGSAFWSYLLGATGIGTFVSGIYPALVLSSFQPVVVLKGRLKNASHGQWMRKGLVIFQFATTTILVITLATIFKQIHFLKNQDLGMDIHRALVLKGPDVDSLYAGKFDVFRNTLLQHPSIHHIAQSTAVPASSQNEVGTITPVYRVGQDKTATSFNFSHYGFDASFIPAFGMQLIAGRNFREGADNNDQVIVNEEAVRALGFRNAEDAISSRITYNTRWPGDGSTIIGVVRDFNQWSPKEARVPMIFPHSTWARYITLNIDADAAREVVAAAEKAWHDVFPASPFSFSFMDERYNEQYKMDEQLSEVLTTFALLAIIISCLGLFGLSSYTVLQRSKEISIRKVLGGSVSGMVRLLSADFMILVVIAATVAMPAAYFVSTEFLSNYSTRITPGVTLFALPFACVLLLAFVTIAAQTFRAARANPANALRSE